MKESSKLSIALICCVLTAPQVLSAQSLVISFNLSDNPPSGTDAFMSAGDLAGADFRVGNWNNINTGPNQSLTGDSIVYSDGSTVGGAFQIDLSTTTTGTVASSLTNDALMFAGVSDLQDGHTATLELSNIPFNSYDVYVYAVGSASNRGGSIELDGATTYYVIGNNTPADDGSGYILATSTVYDSENPGSGIAMANYALFSGLSGNAQTVNLAALDMGNAFDRLRFTGFQIVDTSAVPEPASAAAILGLLSLISFLTRRR